MDYAQYPRPVLEDIVRLRRQMDRLNLPRKLVDRNVLVGTWNIRAFGAVHPKWDENPASPKRNLRAMACIVEIIRRFDVVAIQEVKEDLSGLLLLMDWLGSDWGFVVTDTTAGSAGNTERLAYVFDRRRSLRAWPAKSSCRQPTKAIRLSSLPAHRISSDFRPAPNSLCC
jgi:hypothetical protein